MKKKYIDVEQIQFHYLPISAIGDVYALKNEVDEIPAADVQEVKHGMWTKDFSKRRGDGEIYDYMCDICGTPAIESEYGNCDILSAYCPNCGAKMDGKDI